MGSLHPASPTDMFRQVIEPSKGQDTAARLGIVTTMRSLMVRQPSPDLTAFVKDQLQTTTDPQVRAFMQLIIAEDPRYRVIAEEGLKLLEHKLQEDQAHDAMERIRLTMAEPEPVDAPLQVEAEQRPEEPARGGSEDMLSALMDFSAPDVRPQVVTPLTVQPKASVIRSRSWHTSEAGVESIYIPEGEDPNGPKKRYSYIGPNTKVDRPITSVAGLVINIKGQPQVEEGFGFYMPLPEGLIKLDYTGQKRNVINIAMSLPETIVLFDDHRGPRLGGVSNFFTIYEAMRDGYRFLLNLEIIPVNGRFALSIQEAIFIDRRDADGKIAYVSSAHLNKLGHACSAIGFHAFTGDADYHE